MYAFISLLAALAFAANASEERPLSPGIYGDLQNQQSHRIVLYHGNEIQIYSLSSSATFPIGSAHPESDWKASEKDGVFTRTFNDRKNTLEVRTETSFLLTKEDSQTDAKPVLYVKYADERSALNYVNSPYLWKLNKETESLSLVSSSPKPSAEKAILVHFGSSALSFLPPKKAVQFDFDGNGERTKTTWPSGPESFFLAIDRNSNGAIDNGTELFSPQTPGSLGFALSNGYLALSSYDSDGNGWIDKRDGIFDHLVLWNDANKDGRSTPDELKSLCESGVKAIGSHHYDKRNSDDYGTGSILESRVLLDSGTEVPSYFVHFVRPN
jgi:hypothetical protein